MKTISIKLVYFGCALSGKTTSLRSIFRKYNKEDQLTSIETTTGRTLFFDFGSLQVCGGEWAIKILLYSATGQDFYASTRPATLNGADGVIFVVDSQKQYLQDNIQSWNELQKHYADNFNKLPIIICLNKQDLPEIVSQDEIIRDMNLSISEKIEIVNTVAITGEGVIESFKRMLSFVFPAISIK